MLHYKAVAPYKVWTRTWKVADIALCIFGLMSMVYTTSLTIKSWGGESAPRFVYFHLLG